MKNIPELSKKSLKEIEERFLNDYAEGRDTIGSAFYAMCQGCINQEHYSMDFVDALFIEKYRLGKKLLKIIKMEKLQNKVS